MLIVESRFGIATRRLRVPDNFLQGALELLRIRILLVIMLILQGRQMMSQPSAKTIFFENKLLGRRTIILEFYRGYR